MAELRLPDEIIIEILSKLPVKALLRLQCVCKSLQSLIRIPNFTKIHLNKTLISDSDRHLIHASSHYMELDNFNDHLSFSFKELPHNPIAPNHRFSLVGSCNGVVCIVDRLNDEEIYLFNPLTNSKRKLPSNNNFKNPIKERVDMLFGLGYDSTSDDYKVLTITLWAGRRNEEIKEAHVYSLKSNSWSCCTQSLWDCNCFFTDSFDGVLVNEVLHFGAFVSNDDGLFIAAFDLRSDKFSVMGRLDVLHDDLNWFNLADFCGSLSLSQDGELWVMEDHGNNHSWVKLLAIRPEDVPVSCSFMTPLVYSKDGKRILLQTELSEFVALTKGRSGYHWYNLESKNVEAVTSYGLSMPHLDTVFFTGSLVSLE